MADFQLACDRCGPLGRPARPSTVCEACGGPLLVRYSTEPGSGPALAAEWRGRPPGIWRFAELLPLHAAERPITLGEGDTPLIRLARLGERLELHLHAKDEGRNPTGSFKDRGLAVAVTRAVLDGAPGFVIPSAGNAGVALAAYAARAGLPARIYIPADTPPAIERRCAPYGAEVVRVRGLIAECGRLAAEHAGETGRLDLSTLREPYRIEGKKTMMLEIAEQLGWRAPDAIVYPTGGGTGLIGSWKALRELATIGLANPHTRLYAVQSRGCAPIVRAWEEGREDAPRWEDPRTVAWGLRVPKALGDSLILAALRESRGGAIAVDDSEMQEATRDLGRLEGLSAGIEGGATLAAAAQLRRRGDLAAGETVVLFNTGNTLNY
ncbi:MAG: threonine synthase [Gemmatimonadota bacterium]